MLNQPLTKRFPNVDAPPETENAAPTGIGNGVQKQTKAANFQDEGYTADDVMGKVNVPGRRRYSVRLADGWPMAFTCAPDGLVSAHDFQCADGRVLRVERRVVTIVPPFDLEGAA